MGWLGSVISEPVPSPTIRPPKSPSPKPQQSIPASPTSTPAAWVTASREHHVLKGVGSLFAFSEKGDRVATAHLGEEGRVEVFEVSSRDSLVRIETHIVGGLAISSDGNMLAWCEAPKEEGSASVAVVYNQKQGNRKNLNALSPCEELRFANQGSALLDVKRLLFHDLKTKEVFDPMTHPRVRRIPPLFRRAALTLSMDLFSHPPFWPLEITQGKRGFGVADPLDRLDGLEPRVSHPRQAGLSAERSLIGISTSDDLHLWVVTN
jgi:hypothetical protein